MATAREKCAKKIDRAIDRYAEDVSWGDLELLLQQRAQDMRERSLSADEGPGDVQGLPED